MRSRFLATLAAVAFVAAPAMAQTPYQDGFKYVGTIPGAPSVDGYVGGPYVGAFDITPLTTWGTPFDIWCVDYLHSISGGNIYNAWITPLDGSDFSHTRLGLSSANDYRWTAYLASLMDWYQGTTGPAVTDGPAPDVRIQDAMWIVLGFNTTMFTSSSQTRAAYLDAFGAASGVGLANGWYNTTAPTVFTDWSIITCDPGHSVTGALNPVSSCPYQEFIYRDTPSHTTEVVPEPVTMSLLATGLAGMALASRKRRRNTV